jgi:hypothetical protein
VGEWGSEHEKLFSIPYSLLPIPHFPFPDR